jgi:hypothetical protein
MSKTIAFGESTGLHKLLEGQVLLKGTASAVPQMLSSLCGFSR